MLYRPWMVPFVLIFWAVSSGWLLAAKILPALSPGAPPGYQAFYAAENRLVPVAWTVIWNDQPLGWALSQPKRTRDGGMEVDSLLHFERLPIDQVLPPWIKPMLRQSLEQHAWHSFEAQGHLSIDERGNLRAFRSVVSLPALADKVFLQGRIDQGEVTVDVHTHGMTYSVSRHLPSNIAMSDELSPQATLPGLYRDRQWTVPIYSPLRPGRSPIQILHARVSGEESMFWDDKLVRVDVVQYRDDPAPHREPQCRLWVDPGGRVLKQESSLLGSRLVFLRRSDAAAEDLVAGVGPILEGAATVGRGIESPEPPSARSGEERP